MRLLWGAVNLTQRLALTQENKKRTIARRQNRLPGLLPARVFSPRSTSREIWAGDQPSRSDGPFFLRLPLAGRGAVKEGQVACGVYLPDLQQPRPPDAPPGMVRRASCAPVRPISADRARRARTTTLWR